MAWKLHFTGLICFVFLAHCKNNDSKALQTEVQSSKGQLGLNDVSILIPFHLAKDLRDQVPSLTSKGEQEAFAPEWLGKEIALVQNEELKARAIKRPSDPAGTRTRIEENFSDFRLVAMRVDPCANIRTAKTNPETCVPQFRLIWQRLLNSDGQGKPTNNGPGPFSGADDSDVHTIYKITQPELKEIVKTLRAMHKAASVDTIAMPLQPHPVLAKEGPSSPYLKGMLGIVNRYARASQMSHVAHFSAVNNNNVWQFTLFEIKDGKPVNLEIPTAKARKDQGSMKVQTISRDALNRDLKVMPQPTSPFVLAEEIDYRAPQDVQAIAAATLDQRMMENIAAIENPALHDALNIDCSSCHRALGTYAFAQEREMKAKGKLEERKQAYKSKTWDLTFKVEPFMLEFTGPWTLQMFSYFGTQPKITPRVINESAEVLDFIESQGI